MGNNKKMKIKWYKIRKIKGFFELIIEGRIYPKHIFQVINNKEKYRKLIIRAFDSDVKDFSILTKIFDEQQIDYFKLPNGIEVLNENIRKVFEYTDFGESLDSYELIIEGEYVTITNNEDVFVSFLNMPDLKIRSISKQLLEDILYELKKIESER